MARIRSRVVPGCRWWGIWSVTATLFVTIGVLSGSIFDVSLWNRQGVSNGYGSPSSHYVGVAWAPSLVFTKEAGFDRTQDRTENRKAESGAAIEDAQRSTGTPITYGFLEGSRRTGSRTRFLALRHAEDAEFAPSGVDQDEAPKVAFVHGVQARTGRTTSSHTEEAATFPVLPQEATSDHDVPQLRAQAPSLGVFQLSADAPVVPIVPTAPPVLSPVSSAPAVHPLPSGSAPAVPLPSPVAPVNTGLLPSVRAAVTLSPPATPLSSATYPVGQQPLQQPLALQQPPQVPIQGAPQRPQQLLPQQQQAQQPQQPQQQQPQQGPLSTSTKDEGGTASAASAEAKSEDGQPGLPVGAIVGIVFFCVFVILGLITVAWCLWRDRGVHRSKVRRSSQQVSSPERAISVTLPSNKGGEGRSAIFDPTAFRSLTSRRFQSIEALPSTRMGRTRSGEARATVGASDTENEEKRTSKSPAATAAVSPRSDNGRGRRNFGADGDTHPVAVSDDGTQNRTR